MSDLIIQFHEKYFFLVIAELFIIYGVPLFLIITGLCKFIILIVIMIRLSKKKNKEKDRITEYDYKGIDSILDDELEFYANDSAKKNQVDEILQKGKYDNSHDDSIFRIPFWFEYMSPAKKFNFIAIVLLVLHIPVSIVGTIFLFYGGLLLDGLLYSYHPATNTLGHAAPGMGLLLPLIGIYAFIIIGIVLLLSVIISFIITKIIKEK